MPPQGKNYYLLLVVMFLVLSCVYLVALDLKERKPQLVFAMLDVGQGDALYIKSPTGVEVLVDSGPARKISGPLRKIRSPLDKNIDAIIITNPDLDHIGGFLEILKSNKVGMVIEPGTWNDSKSFQNLKTEIENQKILDFLGKGGMRLDLGGGAFLDILFPDRDVSEWASNDGSLVARLSYGETSIMLTGDATQETEKIIMGEYSARDLESGILKVGHHGSRSSSSSAFVKAVSPELALISSGKDNDYGHPSPETLGVLSRAGINILRTDESGTIILKSDRQNESISFIK